MKVLLVNPRGFCAGVDRAINIVEQVLSLLGAPVYVRHEVVHNRFVVDNFRDRGVVFVETLEAVPDGGLVIFSAHGTPASVVAEAKRRDIRVVDATCPLVTKVHIEMVAYSRDNYEVVLIGHRGHPEVIGTTGQYDAADGAVHLVETAADAERLKVKRPTRLAYVTQTTLSVDDTREIVGVLKQRFPDIKGPHKDDICYATQNRQNAMREIAQECDLVLIIGSANSSNSNRLREIAGKAGVRAHLIDGPDEIDHAWFDGVKTVGISAGASAPESLVQSVASCLRARYDCELEERGGVLENITFKLPSELKRMIGDTQSAGGAG